MNVLRFQGRAQPPPERCEEHDATLTRSEIACLNMGLESRKSDGKPCNEILLEHQPRNCVGRVQASWPDSEGGLRVCGVVDDPKAMQNVRNGSLRGLSLGVETSERAGGKRGVIRHVHHLGLVGDPARAGCYIDQIDGVPVGSVKGECPAPAYTTALCVHMLLVFLISYANINCIHGEVYKRHTQNIINVQCC